MVVHTTGSATHHTVPVASQRRSHRRFAKESGDDQWGQSAISVVAAADVDGRHSMASAVVRLIVGRAMTKGL